MSNALIKKALRCLIVLGQADSEISKEEVAEATTLLRIIDKDELSGSKTEVHERQGNQLGN